MVENPNACDVAGAGAIAAPGMEGLSPATGALTFNPTGRHCTGRGSAPTTCSITSAGLWIASDNLDGSQMCGGVQNLAGICFLPYTVGWSVPGTAGSRAARPASVGISSTWAAGRPGRRLERARYR